MQVFKEKTRALQNKKGNAGVFSTLLAVVTSLAAVAITIVITFLILANGQDQIVSTQGINESNPATFTTAYNASIQTQTATALLPGWLGIIVVAFIGLVLLSVVYLFMRQRY